jgi:hypothetical protein
MAKQKSIIKIQGTLDGITYYQMNGKNYAKKKTEGPSKEKLNSHPSYKRTRENMAEFGGSTAAASGLRKGFLDIPKMIDRTLYQRLVKICRAMIEESPGTRGQRPFTPVAHKASLAQIKLQVRTSFESIFMAPFTLTMPVSRNEATITIPDFNASNMVTAPQGATHFKLINHISVLSAYEFDSTIMKYQPTAPLYNTMRAMEASGYLSISGMAGAETTLRALLYDVEELPVDSVLIICLGIQFYQQVTGGGYYELAADDALKIVQVS